MPVGVQIENGSSIMPMGFRGTWVFGTTGWRWTGEPPVDYATKPTAPPAGYAPGGGYIGPPKPISLWEQLSDALSDAINAVAGVPAGFDERGQEEIAAGVKGEMRHWALAALTAGAGVLLMLAMRKRK